MFDLTNVPEHEYSLLPKGVYSAYVEKAEFKMSKNGSEYLSLMWKLFDEHEGRVVFSNLNLMHSDAQVRNIALSTLKSMLKASMIDKDTFNSKEDLVKTVLDCRSLIKVDIKADQSVIKGADQNVIKGYESFLNKEQAKELHKEIPF